MIWSLAALGSGVTAQSLLAQTNAGDAFPTWVLGTINLGMLGVNFYLYITRRQVTPGEMEARLADQKEQYEKRIEDNNLAHARTVDAVASATAQAIDRLTASVSAERARADRNEAKLDEARDSIVKEMTPALTTAGAAVDRSSELLIKMAEQSLREGKG